MSHDNNSEKPPLFSSWAAWYWLVMAALILQIIFYLILTASFS